MNEDNVVQQIENKNEKAIRFVIDEYGGLMAAIIKRHLNYRQQDYEECLDDVLLSIWNHIHSYDPNKNSFKQWIAAIAKYKAIDYQRKQMIIQNKQITVADINDSMVKVKNPEVISSVEELLEPLSTSERKIFEKYYLEGTPSSEIAKELEVKESWIHNKLSRGRKKLRHFWIQKNEM